MLTSFAPFWRRLNKAKAELAELDAALARLSPGPEANWSRRTMKAFVAESIYTGIESVVKMIADDVDGGHPAGNAWHALLLEGMAAPRAGARPALLSEPTFLLLDELRRFRHVVRNNYALDLGNEGVEQNLEMVREALPRFEADLRDFETTMGIEEGR